MQPCLMLEGVTGGVLLSSRDSVIFRMKLPSCITSAEPPAQMFSSTVVNRYLMLKMLSDRVIGEWEITDFMYLFETPHIGHEMPVA